MSIRFTQSCPTCGRRIQVQTSLMGHSVACSHCRAEFKAVGKEVGEPIATKIQTDLAPVDPLMVRVEQALARASQESTAIG